MDSFFGSLPMPGQKGGATPPESVRAIASSSGLSGSASGTPSGPRDRHPTREIVT